MKIYALIIALFLFATGAAAQSQKPFPGVDLNNTWTGSNDYTGASYIDGVLGIKGPNPYADITRFGGYIGAFTPPTITCTTTATLTTMVCGAGLSDFIIGHGVSIPGAGPAPVVKTPNAPVGITTMSIASNVATIQTSSTVSFTNGVTITGASMTDSGLNGSYTNVQMTGYNTFTASFTHANCSPCSFGPGTFVAAVAASVTPLGQTGGTTSICYIVSAKDLASDAISIGSAPFCTTVGFASLGVQSYTISSCSTTSGLTTFTTTASHNIPNLAGIEFNVVGGTTGSVQEEGSFSTVSTGGTTVVMNHQSEANGTYCPNGGTLKVSAKNLVKWTPQPGITLGHVVWRCVGPVGSTCAANSAYSFVGETAGTDSSFMDYGLGTPTLGPIDAAYIPAHPPSSVVNGIFSSTITGISGTTVTMANSAGASLTGTLVFHDDVPATLAACNSFGTAGAKVYIPAGGASVFNSVFNEANCSAEWLDLTFASQVKVNAPIIPKSFFSFNGYPTGSAGATSSFPLQYQTFVLGSAFPMFLLSLQNGLGLASGTFNDLNMSCAQIYENCFYADQDTNGNNVTTITFNNTAMSGTVGSQPVHFGGGFQFYANGGEWGLSGASSTSWGYPPSILDTPNRGLGQNNQELMGILDFEHVNFGGGEFLVDGGGISPLAAAFGDAIFNQPLDESPFMPWMRINTTNNITGPITIIHPSYADSVGGSGTPVMDLTNSTRINGINVVGSIVNNCGNGPFFQASAAQTAQFSNLGCSSVGLATYVNSSDQGQFDNNNSVGAGGTGALFYAMQTPVAPTATISGGGTVAAGAYCYRVLANDVNGNSTVASPPSNCVTVNGSQAVVVAMTAVPGQASFTVCYNFNAGGYVCTSTGSGFQVSGTSYTHSSVIFPNNSLPQGSVAGSSGLGADGAFGYQFVFPQNGFMTTLSGTSSANRTQTFPDASGPVALEIFGSLTTTSATTDNVTLTGMTSTGHCFLTPTNASGATNIATTYVSAKTTNQITVTHTASSGLTYDIGCAPY